MRMLGKLSLAVLLAVAVLQAAVGTASANRLEFSENHIRAVWEAAERTRFIDTGGTFGIECQVTIEGSFHSRVISKLSGQLIGFVTVAEAPFMCFAGGEVAILNGSEPLPGGGTATNSLPWHIRYDSFSGTLPNITGIRIQIVGAAILMWNGLVQCLFKSTEGTPLYAILEVAAGTITAMRWDETRAIPKFFELSLGCPPSAKLTKRSTSFTVQGGMTGVFVRLIQ
jgi:hypothetical protein